MRLLPIAISSWLIIVSPSLVRASSDFTSNALRKFCSDAHTGFLRAVPALSRNPRKSNVSKVHETKRQPEETSPEFKKAKPHHGPLHYPRRPRIDIQKLNERIKKGSYYGMTPIKIQQYVQKSSTRGKTKDTRKLSTVERTLEEVRSMRVEMEALRKELQSLRRQIAGESQPDESSTKSPDYSRRKGALVKRQRHFERVGLEVERWAEQIKNEGEDHGWTEVHCSKLFRTSLNPDGRTQAFIKWMKDSRGEDADIDDDREYPCIKVCSTIEAPIDVVSRYLSQEDRSKEYNDLIVQHNDLEELSPSSKIVWGASPKILFLQPRQFVTYCSHRWLRDGSQVIINQACDHEQKQGNTAEAYALRGANFIEKDPQNPEKTRITIISHASPGRDVPGWAMKTAVNALAPIEPFKLFNKINEGVKRALPTLQQPLEATEMVSVSAGRSNRPAGMAQLGYACFWPEGGGPVENFGNQEQGEIKSPGTKQKKAQSRED